MSEFKYGQKVAAEFSTLFDIDIGILKHIQKKYTNSKFINPYILSANDYFLKSLVIIRSEKNIFNTVLKDEFKSNADSLYNELITSDDYFIVVDKAIQTSIYSLLEIYSKTPGIIGVTILCDNKYEYNFIKNLTISKSIKFTPVLVTNHEFDISSYNAVFVRDIDNILEYFKYHSFFGCTIYMLDYSFNYQILDSERLIKRNPLLILGDTNFIFTVSPYTDFVLPSEGMDNDTIIKEEGAL